MKMSAVGVPTPCTCSSTIVSGWSVRQFGDPALHLLDPGGELGAGWLGALTGSSIALSRNTAVAPIPRNSESAAQQIHQLGHTCVVAVSPK